MKRWGCAFAVALVLAGCGGDDDSPEAAATPHPALERLGAACTAYREATMAELPPALPAEWGAYIRERGRLVDRFVAAVRKEPAEGPVREPRGRLLAAGSNVLSIVNEISGGTDLDSFAAVLFTRAGALGAYDGGLDEAAQKAGIACGLPPDASPEIREFRREAGTVCEAYDPPVAGVPRRIAGLVRQRADEHSRLALPADATDLERDTLAAERELARVAAAVPLKPKPRDAALYVALAARTSEGWRRQGVTACVDLPTEF